MCDWHCCLQFEGKAVCCRDSDQCCHSCIVAFPPMSGRVCLVPNVLAFLTDVNTFYINILISHTTENTKFYSLKPTSLLCSWEIISVL